MLPATNFSYVCWINCFGSWSITSNRNFNTWYCSRGIFYIYKEQKLFRIPITTIFFKKKIDSKCKKTWWNPIGFLHLFQQLSIIKPIKLHDRLVDRLDSRLYLSSITLHPEGRSIHGVDDVTYSPHLANYVTLPAYVCLINSISKFVHILAISIIQWILRS